ncbi:hypothetical protein NMY22_g10503 [Coprinellus aureogranulatus]|nr:hypothetical protein NMY22_g10503 [Coprinellus aureogranulatus]
MLFTRIQLDDFQPTLARFIERLDIEGADEKEWIMMGLGVVGPKDAAGAQQAATMRVMAKKAAAGVPGAVNPEEMMDVDADSDRVMRGSPGLSSHQQLSPPSPTTDLPDCPPSLSYALQLTFSMLSLVLRRPLRQPSTYARSTLNPYLTVILTFLSTILKQQAALSVLERAIPWQELATFFGTIPRRVMTSQGLLDPSAPSVSGDRWPMLTSGVSPPLSEDWCMRGMEWVGRKVFERGYWKSGEERKAELEVLELNEGIEVSDGTIEDDEEDSGTAKGPKALSELERRWIRICRAAVNISGCVEGLEWKEGTREWSVEGKLAQKVQQWKEEDRIEKLEEERRRLGRRWTDDAMEIDEADMDEGSSSDDDDENDSEEVKALKARRRYLKNLLASSRQSVAASSRQRPRSGKKTVDNRPALNIVPGYTILVVDTNILLSSLPMITSLVESMKWTVVVPLPVIMELDGLASNITPQLADAASAAINYIASHVRSHAVSLKVQTSKGNYLTSLNVRTEDVDFGSDRMSNERTMDDLILKAAIWQDEHWQDRSAMLKADPASAAQTANAVKVVFVSLDRNLRLKARSRQLAAAGEKDLAALMSLAT